MCAVVLMRSLELNWLLIWRRGRAHSSLGSFCLILLRGKVNKPYRASPWLVLQLWTSYLCSERLFSGLALPGEGIWPRVEETCWPARCHSGVLQQCPSVWHSPQLKLISGNTWTWGRPHLGSNHNIIQNIVRGHLGDWQVLERSSKDILGRHSRCRAMPLPTLRSCKVCFQVIVDPVVPSVYNKVSLTEWCRSVPLGSNYV